MADAVAFVPYFHQLGKLTELCMATVALAGEDNGLAACRRFQRQPADYDVTCGLVLQAVLKAAPKGNGRCWGKNWLSHQNNYCVKR